MCEVGFGDAIRWYRAHNPASGGQQGRYLVYLPGLNHYSMLPVRLYWPAVGVAVCLLAPAPGAGQALGAPATPDSVGLHLHRAPRPSAPLRRVLVPGLLMGAGALTTHHTLELKTDWSVREELGEHVPAMRTTLDDQLRHVPAAAALGLSLAGVRGEHSTVNQALLVALTYTLNNTLTSNLKRLTRVERPYGSGDYSSFPSQHASAAFSAARLLDREYGARSGWYRVGGYTVATSVAALRLINGKHWLSDVVAGVGVGLASTELAYGVYPTVHRLLLRGLQDRAVVLPYYQGGATGLLAVVRL